MSNACVTCYFERVKKRIIYQQNKLDKLGYSNWQGLRSLSFFCWDFKHHLKSCFKMMQQIEITKKHGACDVFTCGWDMHEFHRHFASNAFKCCLEGLLKSTKINHPISMVLYESLPRKFQGGCPTPNGFVVLEFFCLDYPP